VIGDNMSTKVVRRDRLLRLGGVVGNSSINLRLSLSTIFRGGCGGGGSGDRPGELESGVSGVSGETISRSAIALTRGSKATVNDPETSGGDAGISSTALLSTDMLLEVDGTSLQGERRG
jgi:hypothetical protein